MPARAYLGGTERNAAVLACWIVRNWPEESPGILPREVAEQIRRRKGSPPFGYRGRCRACALDRGRVCPIPSDLVQPNLVSSRTSCRRHSIVVRCVNRVMPCRMSAGWQIPAITLALIHIREIATYRP